MKNTLICLLALALLSTAALAAPDSLACRMVDWVQEESAHEFVHRLSGPGYEYSGTCRWDLAIGDSFLVWAAATCSLFVFDAYETDSLRLRYIRWASPWPICGLAFKDDSMFYTTSGMQAKCYNFSGDSIRYNSLTRIWYADFCYAVVEDSFLYTYTWSDGSIAVAEYCINIANPESIFVYRTANSPVVGLATAGLEVINGYSYIGNSRIRYFTDPERWIPYFGLYVANMQALDSAVAVTNVEIPNRCLGDLASNDSLVFYVNCYMGDGPYGFPIGQSNLYAWDRDYTHEFDQRWLGQGVFGVDVIGDHLLAVGFEHGLSILNISNLDSIYEAAYYLQPDSVMDFTHFALKENRLYAMGHNGYDVRLYMFELDTCVTTNQCEVFPLPGEMRLRSYPNPFNSDCRFAIEWAFPHKDAQLDIFDVTGRIVFTDTLTLRNGQNQYRWAPDGLPSGVYLARVSTKETSVTSKLVYIA